MALTNNQINALKENDKTPLIRLSEEQTGDISACNLATQMLDPQEDHLLTPNTIRLPQEHQKATNHFMNNEAVPQNIEIRHGSLVPQKNQDADAGI